MLRGAFLAFAAADLRAQGERKHIDVIKQRGTLRPGILSDGRVMQGETPR